MQNNSLTDAEQRRDFFKSPDSFAVRPEEVAQMQVNDYMVRQSRDKRSDIPSNFKERENKGDKQIPSNYHSRENEGKNKVNQQERERPNNKERERSI